MRVIESILQIFNVKTKTGFQRQKVHDCVELKAHMAIVWETSHKKITCTKEDNHTVLKRHVGRHVGTRISKIHVCTFFGKQ